MQRVLHRGGDLVGIGLLWLDHRIHQALGRERSEQNSHSESDEHRRRRGFFDRIDTVLDGIVPVFLKSCFGLLRRGLRGHVSPGDECLS